MRGLKGWIWRRITLLITRVVITNYKSIARCDVPLGPLTFLVGLNGSGKSNLIDALRFCRDALQSTLDSAISRRHAGIRTHRSVAGFGMQFALLLSDQASATYSFHLAPTNVGGLVVDREECEVLTGAARHWFCVENGAVSGSVAPLPVASTTRLYLVNASGVAEFRPVYDALAEMEFYDPKPELMAHATGSTGFGKLRFDASNAADVVKRLDSEDLELMRIVNEYMRVVLPGLVKIKAKFQDQDHLGGDVYLEFDQANGHVFKADQMSDGTLRGLGILLALFQRNSIGSAPSLVAIEEPESGLHPAAAGVLFDALQAGSLRGQVIATTHSGDLLDNSNIAADSILAVTYSEGSTKIAPLGEVTRSILRDRLYTAGELLRMDRLQSDR